MIGKLTGKLSEVREDSVVVDIGGVGYLVHLPTRYLDRLRTGVGERLSLYTHTYVREDALELYGFPSREGLGVFEMLLGVSRVGPRLALAVLDIFEADDFRSAIDRGDVALLTEVSGVGRKTAERLILELQDKVDSIPVAMDRPDAADRQTLSQRRFSEAVGALEALGYSKTQATQAVRQCVGELDSTEEKTPQVEDMVRSALKLLSEEGGMA